MVHNLHSRRGKRVLGHDRHILQDHTPRQIGQLPLQQRALAAVATADVNKHGRLSIGPLDQRLEVGHIQPRFVSTHGSHPCLKLGHEIGGVLPRPLEGGKVCVVGYVEYRLVRILWVLEFVVFEIVWSFEERGPIRTEASDIQ